jgi:hypothetical protein
VRIESVWAGGRARSNGDHANNVGVLLSAYMKAVRAVMVPAGVDIRWEMVVSE